MAKHIKLTKAQARQIKVTSAVKPSRAPHSAIRGSIYRETGTAVSPLVSMVQDNG